MNNFGLPDCQVYQPEIRFVDIDAASIVNNAVYFNYFEQSRIRFFEGIVGSQWDWNVAGMVVARHEIDYRLPIHFNDDVRIVTWIDHVGTKSMTAAYEVIKRSGERWKSIASARTVLVSFDHHLRVSKPWPVTLVQSVNAFGVGRPMDLDVPLASG